MAGNSFFWKFVPFSYCPEKKRKSKCNFQSETKIEPDLRLTRSQKENKNKERWREFHVVIKRRKSNILLLNVNLKSGKTLRWSVFFFYLNISDIGFSNKVHKIKQSSIKSVCGNKHLHAKEFSIWTYRSMWLLGL